MFSVKQKTGNNIVFPYGLRQSGKWPTLVSLQIYRSVPSRGKSQPNICSESCSHVEKLIVVACHTEVNKLANTCERQLFGLRYIPVSKHTNATENNEMPKLYFLHKYLCRYTLNAGI